MSWAVHHVGAGSWPGGSMSSLGAGELVHRTARLEEDRVQNAADCDEEVAARIREASNEIIRPVLEKSLLSCAPPPLLDQLPLEA